MRIPGSWTVARPFGVPVRIHWSVPLFALLAGGIKIAPGAWLAAVLLVLLHEAGHAFVVRRVGARATALDVLGFGGLCWWEGDVTPIQRAYIAWGGIWAQLIIFAATAACVGLLGDPTNAFVADMVRVALWSNLWLIGINLLPIPPLDGQEAWSLFPLLRRRFARRRAARASATGAPRASSLLDRLSTRGRPDDARELLSRALPGVRLRVNAPRLDPKQIQNPTAIDDDIDEGSFTPEVEAVLERARAIARDAAHDAPQRPSSRPKPGAGGGSPASGDRDP